LERKRESPWDGTSNEWEPICNSRFPSHKRSLWEGNRLLTQFDLENPAMFKID
jgi:hypothetical protein